MDYLPEVKKYSHDKQCRRSDLQTARLPALVLFQGRTGTLLFGKTFNYQCVNRRLLPVDRLRFDITFLKYLFAKNSWNSLDVFNSLLDLMFVLRSQRSTCVSRDRDDTCMSL